MKTESSRSLNAINILSIFWSLLICVVGTAALIYTSPNTDSRFSEAISHLISYPESGYSAQVLTSITESAARTDQLVVAQSKTIHSFGEAAIAIGILAIVTSIGNIMVQIHVRSDRMHGGQDDASDSDNAPI